MDQLSLYDQILGLTAPWHTTSVDLDEHSEQVSVTVKFDQSSAISCPVCNKHARIYDFRQRSWRHLDTCQFKTIITADVPRIECSEHSVQTQYRAQGYVDYLRSNGCRLSMSRKGNCWDNAPMESFFSRLKVELVYAKNYSSIEEAKSGIFAYIEILYNRKRRHSANDDMSPIAFEEKAAMAA
jgi:transposase|tara:strand:+ start:366 stop:914 length:549 start_codon:yes stop_codon:yes gene_type:complete